MTPEELSIELAQAVRQAVADGQVTLDQNLIPQRVHVERPRQSGHGDWATNVAMQLGSKAGLAPRQLAEILVQRIAHIDGIEAAEVAGPGFINLTLAKSAAGALAQQIVDQGRSFGHSTAWRGQTFNVEFVSANPTGPIHLAGARWAAVGDSLARVIEAQGARVVREYYFNDHGSQIDRFAASLLCAARGRPLPEDGYAGDYISQIARQVEAHHPDAAKLPDGEAAEIFRTTGCQLMFAQIKQSLHQFGVDFDVYFHEHDLHRSGAVDQALEQLKQAGNLYLSDGAWWLRSTAFGDDKDRVVIRSDGAPAYVAADIAYFKDKRDRGADHAIYLLGADHHGYIARLKAAAAALGDDPDKVEVLIGQLVFLLENGQVVRMSKRAGNVVTMEDLVDAIGVDAARYVLVRSSVDSPLEIDLALWRKRSNDNPVYYVQYAHARTCSVAANASQAGVERHGFEPACLAHQSEAVLLTLLADFPRVLAQAAELREAHRVARYLEQLAAAYHKWYDQCRVIPLAGQEIEAVHRARLYLNDATGQVLAGGLELLGVSAPERM